MTETVEVGMNILRIEIAGTEEKTAEGLVVAL